MVALVVELGIGRGGGTGNGSSSVWFVSWQLSPTPASSQGPWGRVTTGHDYSEHDFPNISGWECFVSHMVLFLKLGSPNRRGERHGRPRSPALQEGLGDWPCQEDLE